MLEHDNPSVVSGTAVLWFRNSKVPAVQLHLPRATAAAKGKGTKPTADELCSSVDRYFHQAMQSHTKPCNAVI